MNYSFSTVLMSILASNLIMIVMSFCFRRQKVLLAVGYKVMIAFIFLTLVRFLFPFELPFARNLQLPRFLSMIVMSVRHHFFVLNGLRFSLWNILELIWLAGGIVASCPYLRECYELHNYVAKWGIDVTNMEPYASILADIRKEQKAKFRVILTKGVGVPRLYGLIRPCILLPEEMALTTEDLHYVFRHEIAHHHYHDLIVKFFVRISSILYWWNPACRRLRKQVELLLEMRIDHSLVQGNREETVKYLATLVHVADMALDSNLTPPSGSMLSLAKDENGTLSRRTDMMLNAQGKSGKHLAAGIFILTASLYLVSYLFTFEGLYTASFNTENTFGDQETLYAVQKADGSYDIYMGDLFLENVGSLEYFLPGMPIYKDLQ